MSIELHLPYENNTSFLPEIDRFTADELMSFFNLQKLAHQYLSKIINSASPCKVDTVDWENGNFDLNMELEIEHNEALNWMKGGKKPLLKERTSSIV